MKTSITTNQATTLIKNTKGKIFSCKFTKKDGTVRKMVARLGTHTKLRGGESTTKHIPNLITCYDMQNKGYRHINTSSLTDLKVGGKEYTVTGE